MRDAIDDTLTRAERQGRDDARETGTGRDDDAGKWDDADAPHGDDERRGETRRIPERGEYIGVSVDD